MSSKYKVQKSGFNYKAMLLGPFWYIYRGMIMKGMLLVLVCICTLGIAAIPIWIYCGFNANSDFYKFLKVKGIYINFK